MVAIRLKYDRGCNFLLSSINTTRSHRSSLVVVDFPLYQFMNAEEKTICSKMGEHPPEETKFKNFPHGGKK